VFGLVRFNASRIFVFAKCLNVIGCRLQRAWVWELDVNFLVGGALRVDVYNDLLDSSSKVAVRMKSPSQSKLAWTTCPNPDFKQTRSEGATSSPSLMLRMEA
jgi:hypothetical protein